MTADGVLTLAWLALAHLGADFVIQTNGMATRKFGSGRAAWQALGAHVLGVAVCLLPFVLAFGGPGLAALAVIVAAHLVIDRAKIVETRRADAKAMAEARALHEGPLPAASLGTAWTPTPAFLFVLDQAAHAVVILAAWWVFLAGAPVVDPFGSVVRSALGAGDGPMAQRVVLTAVVLLDLAIVNVRAGSLFVATLVHPRAVATGAEGAVGEPAGSMADGRAAAAADEAASASTAPGIGSSGAGVAPMVGPGAASSPAPPVGSSGAAPAVASPARVGATIGILERLLIVAFVLTNTTAAVGFVVAAKTIARFKQLDDRAFAEYYLLGTLGSVSVALASALVAAAALNAA